MPRCVVAAAYIKMGAKVRGGGGGAAYIKMGAKAEGCVGGGGGPLPVRVCVCVRVSVQYTFVPHPPPPAPPPAQMELMWDGHLRAEHGARVPRRARPLLPGARRVSGSRRGGGGCAPLYFLGAQGERDLWYGRGAEVLPACNHARTHTHTHTRDIGMPHSRAGGRWLRVGTRPTRATRRE